MDEWRRSQFFARCAGGLLLALALTATGLVRAEQYRLYRCPTADGGTEFRAYPCAEGQGEEFEVQDRVVGWEAPPPTPSPAEEIRAQAKASAPAAKTRAADAKAQEERCWHMQQRLEQVSNKLRRGYKASQGNRLHEQQAEYEDYLRRFCRPP